MKKNNKRDILQEIYNNFIDDNFHAYKYDLDLNYKSIPVDVSKTSYNLDFCVSTEQSKSENVYFNCSLFDYETKKSYDLGYFYFKDNNGCINKNMMLFLADIIAVANDIMENIFRNN